MLFTRGYLRLEDRNSADCLLPDLLHFRCEIAQRYVCIA